MGVGGYPFIAVLRMTIDHASLSRRSTVASPHEATSYHPDLLAFHPDIAQQPFRYLIPSCFAVCGHYLSPGIAIGAGKGGNRRTYSLLASIVPPLTTHSPRDEAPFLLPMETPPTFGRSSRFFHAYDKTISILVRRPWPPWRWAGGGKIWLLGDIVTASFAAIGNWRCFPQCTGVHVVCVLLHAFSRQHARRREVRVFRRILFPCHHWTLGTPPP